VTKAENVPVLENWAVVWDDISPYSAPEIRSPRIKGDVYGHSLWKDGDCITTTSPVSRKGTVIRTKSGSYYQLGKVHPRYEESFGDALNRVLKSIPED
jgi:hypothetical protein